MMISMEPESHTVLVVDDEEEALRAMATLLERRGGYRTLAAKSADEARKLLAEYDIDLVVTDLRMPGMDGLQLLAHINREYPTVSVIISTAFASVDSAVDALRQGAVDYLQKPNQPREMLEKVAEVLKKRDTFLREQAEQAAIREIAEMQTNELLRAGAIQQRWIPEGYDGRNIRVITRFHGVGALSGDFIDIVELADGKLGIVVGDVVGHGLPASLQMGIVQRLIRRELLEGKSASEIFASINDFLYDEYHMDSAFTAFLAIFDGSSYALNYSIGGHPPPILVEAKGGLRFLETSCPGLLMVPKFKFTQHELKLHKGDRIVIYTDGLVEARSESSELFGDERLAEILAASTGFELMAIVDEIELRLAEFRGRAQVTDDISLIVAEMT